MMLGLGLTVYIWLQPWAYRKTGDGLGVAFFPTIFVAGIVISSIMGLIELNKGKKRQKGRTGETTQEQSGIEIFNWPVAVLSVAGFAASFAIVHCDPLILTGALALIILIVGKVRKWYLLAGVAVVVPLLIYIFFVQLAGVFFPTRWFGY